MICPYAFVSAKYADASLHMLRLSTCANLCFGLLPALLYDPGKQGDPLHAETPARRQQVKAASLFAAHEILRPVHQCDHDKLQVQSLNVLRDK